LTAEARFESGLLFAVLPGANDVTIRLAEFVTGIAPVQYVFAR
jgi:hypothetical protein